VTEQSPKRQSAIAFSERLLGVAIDTVASSKVEITELGARDPKIVALALLCRTISNFKGAMVMVREDLIIEAQTLTRCCYENLIWIAALRDRGSQFVNDMLNDEAANRKTVGQNTLKLSSRAGANSEAADARLLRELIRQSEAQFPDGRKLHVDKTASGTAIELVYATYAQLSLGSAHPTITALGRHLRSELEGNTRHFVIHVVPEVPEKQLLRTMRWACEAFLGVIVACNEMLGGTRMNDAIREAFEEQPRVFTLDADGYEKEVDKTKSR